MLKKLILCVMTLSFVAGLQASDEEHKKINPSTEEECAGDKCTADDQTLACSKCE